MEIIFFLLSIQIFHMEKNKNFGLICKIPQVAEKFDFPKESYAIKFIFLFSKTAGDTLVIV